MNSDERRRLYGIQYLRAVAALGVVLVHAPTSLQVFGLGVDLFFVLSGFLMVAITDGKSRPGPFLAARVLRVVPLYWLVTLIMLAAQLTGAAWRGTLSLGHIASSFLFIPAVYPGDGRILPLVAQGWTLNYEMLFYGLFALTLLVARHRQVPLLTVMIFALVGAGLLLEPSQPALATWMHPFALEFLAGAWVGAFWQKNVRLWPLLALCLLLVAALAAAATFNPIFGRPAGLALVVAALLGVLMLERRPGGVPAWRLPLLLGDASYSIYLWQVFPLMLFDVVGERFGLPPAVEGLAFFVAALLVGVAGYVLIERPLLRLIGRARRYRRGVPIPGGI